MNNDIKDKLIKLAYDMLDTAYCPYSGYKVGSAILADDGKIYTGCNIENASYPATICAERTAATKAISEGAKSFKMICIASSGNTPPYPCGVCRQFLNEFIEEDIEVILVKGNKEVLETTFHTIFPNGFKEKDML